MSRCKTNMRRGFSWIGVTAVMLLGSGCIQRGAPVEVVGAPVAPRAQVQQGYETPWPPQRLPSSPPNYQPPPLAQTQPLPPPDVNPRYGEVGTPGSRFQSPQPTRRPFDRRVAEVEETPITPLDFGDEPRADSSDPDARLTPSDRDPEEAPRGPQPRASDDYATLLGDGENADTSSPTPNATNNPAAAANGSQTLVALLVPESDRRGQVRALADGLAKAASLAAGDFNNPRLVLRKYDTGGDPRKAADAAKKALADGATLIIGPLFAGSAAAVRPIAQAKGVSTIAFTTDTSVLGGGLYSIGFLPQTEIDRIVSYAGSKGRGNIAVFAPDSPYGNVITTEARAVARRTGANIVKVQPFKDDFRSMDITATDFAEYYQGASKVDALLMPTNGRTLGALAAYLAYRDVLPTDVKYMGLGLWDDPETFREATLQKGWFPGIDPALKIDFGYRYGQAYGGEPPSIAFLGYDAVAVAAALLENGGSDPFNRQAILTPSGFSGMSGLFRFRADGRNDRALSILEVGQGDFRVIDPAPSDFSALAGG